MISFGIQVQLSGSLDPRWDMHIPLLQQQIRQAAPRKSGALEQSLTVTKHSETAARARSPLPYAFIQNFGGTVPARKAKGNGPMMWKGDYGWVKAWKVGPSRIPPKNYIERGVDAWYKHISVEWGGNG